MTAVAVALAAAAGSVCRYLVNVVVQARVEATLPIGTLIVNVTGSLALGVVAGLGIYHGLGSTARAVAGTGFLGGYTTFSTFAYETARLAHQEERDVAATNVIASAGFGLLAAAAGLALAAAL